MCCRYYVKDLSSSKRVDISPCDEAVVLIAGRDGNVIEKKMIWGFRDLRNKPCARPMGQAEAGTAPSENSISLRTGSGESIRPGSPVFNARSETAAEKPMFRDSLSRRRCVIPAKGFYEWNKAGEKAEFEAMTGELLYFAGCYRFENGIPHFVIFTTNSNESMKKSHDRMPLILKKEQIENWLVNQYGYSELLVQTPEALKRAITYEQQIFDFI